MGISIICDSCSTLIKDDTYDLCKLCNPRKVICRDCTVKHVVNFHLEEIVYDKMYEIYDSVDSGQTIAEKMKIDISNGKQKRIDKYAEH